ncbi:hypothetical protein MTO96_039655, partial [Rhipicephalus appendiculatus]
FTLSPSVFLFVLRLESRRTPPGEHERTRERGGPSSKTSNDSFAFFWFATAITDGRYTAVGRSFFSAHLAASLGGGREAWHGHYQSVQLCEREVTLNVDVSATAFYKAQPVTEFMCEVLRLRGVTIRFRLTESQRVELAKEITCLKVVVTHGDTRRWYRVRDVTRKAAHRQTFPWQLENGETDDCTVAEYFLRRYGIELSFPAFKWVQRTEKAYLPLEVCDIAAGQKCTKKLTDTQTSRLIRESALSAPDRENEISNLVRNANFSMDPYAQEFDVSVTNTMMEVTGRVLPAPELLYGGSTQQRVEPRKGVWDMRGKKFYEPAVLDTWALACFAPREICREHTLRGFMQKLRTTAIAAGMSMNLLVVVLPGKTPIYAEVKRVGNTVLRVATQCVYFRYVTTLDEQILSNLCLKINAKLGGINCIVKPEMRPPVFKEPVIFLGTSVTHPQNGDKNFSIAA